MPEFFPLPEFGFHPRAYNSEKFWNQNWHSILHSLNAPPPRIASHSFLPWDYAITVLTERLQKIPKYDSHSVKCQQKQEILPCYTYFVLWWGYKAYIVYLWTITSLTWLYLGTLYEYEPGQLHIHRKCDSPGGSATHYMSDGEVSNIWDN